MRAFASRCLCADHMSINTYSISTITIYCDQLHPGNAESEIVSACSSLGVMENEDNLFDAHKACLCLFSTSRLSKLDIILSFNSSVVKCMRKLVRAAISYQSLNLRPADIELEENIITIT